jgi:hypothetical protein
MLHAHSTFLSLLLDYYFTENIIQNISNFVIRKLKVLTSGCDIEPLDVVHSTGRHGELCPWPGANNFFLILTVRPISTLSDAVPLTATRLQLYNSVYIDPSRVRAFDSCPLFSTRLIDYSVYDNTRPSVVESTKDMPEKTLFKSFTVVRNIFNMYLPGAMNGSVIALFLPIVRDSFSYME